MKLTFFPSTEYLSDRLAPYCFDSKFHKEIERLNSLKTDSIRYPHVYKNIIITAEKVNVIRDFWNERNANELRKGVPYGVDKRVWEENLGKCSRGSREHFRMIGQQI